MSKLRSEKPSTEIKPEASELSLICIREPNRPPRNIYIHDRFINRIIFSSSLRRRVKYPVESISFVRNWYVGRFIWLCFCQQIIFTRTSATCTGWAFCNCENSRECVKFFKFDCILFWFLYTSCFMYAIREVYFVLMIV